MLISLHEFIKTEGYSYIDFGIKCKSTLKIQLGLKMAQATGGVIVGGEGRGEADSFRFFNYGNQAFLDFGSGDGYNRIHGGIISPNTYYDIEIGNRYVKNMNTGDYFCSSSPVSFADKTYNLQYANDGACIGWLYYIKIYYSDLLVLDGVPALRGSKTGIYDKINKKFIENSGTKEFMLGKQIGTVSDGTVSDRKYLISDSDKYYTVVDSALSEISITELNAQAFQDYGFDALPNGTLLATLSHPKLLYWQSDESAELPNITAKVTATPQGQYISKVIDMSNASISGIKAVTVKCAGTPWFSCSFDGGNTWMEYSGGSWIEVESYGMTEETLTAITSDEWNAVTSGIDSFIMRVLLRDSADSLTNLSVNFLNKTT